MCVACGGEWPIAGSWLSFADLAAATAHRCGDPADGDPVDPAVARFVAERLTAEAGAYVSMESVREAWETWPAGDGRYPPSGLFARKVRAALPPGVDVRRRRIGEERQTWIMGMRLR